MLKFIQLRDLGYNWIENKLILEGDCNMQGILPILYSFSYTTSKRAFVQVILRARIKGPLRRGGRSLIDAASCCNSTSLSSWRGWASSFWLRGNAGEVELCLRIKGYSRESGFSYLSITYARKLNSATCETSTLQGSIPGI